MTPAQVAHIMSLVDEYAALISHHQYALAKDKRTAVEAALRDAPQAGGWVMVPVEPTNAMVGRFFDAIEGGPDWDDTPDDDDDKVEAFAEFSKGYRAMLKARPSAPTAVEPDERVPLTNEQIEPLAASVIGYSALLPEEMKLFTDCVRAVEAAHGIAARASKGTPL